MASFYVPVRDMRSMLHQCCDDTSQGEEALVDVPGFPSPFIHSPRPPYVLTASQIHLDGVVVDASVYHFLRATHQIKLSCLQHFLTIDGAFLHVDGYREDRV